MSDTDKLEIRVETTADTSALEGAREKLGELGDAAQQAGEAAGALAEQSQDATEGIGDLTQNTGEAADGTGALNELIKSLTDALEDMQRQVDDVAHGLDTMGGTAQKTGRAMEASGLAGSKAMGALSVATTAASGNFSGAAMQAGRLAASIKGIGMSAPQIMIATGLFTSLLMLVKALATEADNARRQLDSIKDTNLTNAINKSKEAYDKLADSIKNVNELRGAEDAHNASMEEAYNKQALAALNLAKAKELASAETPEQRAEIEARYAQAAHAENALSGARQDANKITELENKAAGIEDEISALQGRIPQLLSHAKAKGDASVYNANLANDAGFWTRLAAAFPGTGGGTIAYRMDESNRLGGESQAIMRDAENVRKEIQAKENELANVRRQTDVARETSAANEMNRGATDIATNTAVQSARKAGQARFAEQQRIASEEARRRAEQEADASAAATDARRREEARQQQLGLQVSRDIAMGNARTAHENFRSGLGSAEDVRAANKEVARANAELAQYNAANSELLRGVSRLVKRVARLEHSSAAMMPPGN